MKSKKLHKKLDNLDFVEGIHYVWIILIQTGEFSFPYRYMDIGFETENEAKREVERIKENYVRKGKSIYSIEVRKIRTRKLKKPISVS